MLDRAQLPKGNEKMGRGGGGGCVGGGKREKKKKIEPN